MDQKGVFGLLQELGIGKWRRSSSKRSFFESKVIWNHKHVPDEATVLETHSKYMKTTCIMVYLLLFYLKETSLKLKKQY